jgi:BirA family biotin operon repressor/biotin-[acetyl-CoA-carboxylase] ligase
VIDSTSSYIKKNYLKLNNLDIVTANKQTNGRGRNNKKWFNNYNEDILLSLLIKDQEIINQHHKLSLFVAVVLLEFLKEININNVYIKWPNDVYVNDKKIAGILLEGISTSNDIEAIIIGIGINVNSKDFLGEYKVVPTSIYNETGIVFDLDKLKEKFIETLLNKLKKLNNIDFIKISNSNNYLLNKTATIVYKNKEKNIKILGINDDCSLRVLIDGKEENIISGEVSIKLV